MVLQAILSNASHPEYGQLTVPLPIPASEYEHIMEMLEQIEIGSAVKQDCQVDEIQGGWPALCRMERTAVNIDELDYLAKRLDSFDDYEKAQFQGMAERLQLHGVDELINLTFCSQAVTVVTDFNNAAAIGRRHYLTMNEGVPLEEMQRQDFREIARDLIEGEVGRVTPFGVVYDNNFEMSQLYDGRNFPEYRYESCVMEVEMCSRFDSEEAPGTTLYLPLTQAQIERAMLRAGIDNYGDMRLRFMESELPDAIDVALDMEHESLGALNEMCAAIQPLSREDVAKLGVVVSFAQPEYAFHIKHLADNLDLFDFAPNVQTPEDYGRYMIQESGRYEYDENLDEYYDFAGYGRNRMEHESGFFGDGGYIAYHGTLSLDELMMEDPSEHNLGMKGME